MGDNMKAIWKGEVIAESDNTIVIEGNHYFPPESVVKEYLKPTDTTSVCPWKGTAHYYSVAIGDQEIRDDLLEIVVVAFPGPILKADDRNWFWG